MTGASAEHRRRLRSQLLTGEPATSVEGVVDRLLAVQAQDERGFRLAIRARSAGLGVEDVEDALSERRSLVVAWLNRGTLHLVRSQDYWWLHPLTAPQHRASNETRLRQEGVSALQAAQGVEVVLDQVSRGPQTRAGLRAALHSAGVPTAGQAFTHVLLKASREADLVRGPVIDGEHAFVSAGQWLGPPPAAVDPQEALARLAQRYLAGHGPAEPADLARWAAVPLGTARRALAAAADLTPETAQSSESAGPTEPTGPTGPVEPSGRGGQPAPGVDPSYDVPPPMLLGAFDPLLHGWVDRSAVVGRHRGIVTTNGLFRPFALVEGRAVATWGLAGGVVTVTALEPLSRSTIRALEDEAARVLDFLGLPETAPRLVEAPD